MMMELLKDSLGAFFRDDAALLREHGWTRAKEPGKWYHPRYGVLRKETAVSIANTSK